MDKLYRKKENGRYELAGYDVPRLTPGIWVAQEHPYGHSITSLVWRVGDVKRACDVITHAAIGTMLDEVSKYLCNLKEENSEEYKQAKEMLGGYLKAPPEFFNISAADFAALVLRKVSLIIEEQENESDK